MSANTLYERDGEMKIGSCDIAVFEWFPRASNGSELLIMPHGNTKPERVPRRQIQYIVHNRVGCTPQVLDWCTRVMASAEYAERFAKEYLGFLSSLRLSTLKSESCPVFSPIRNPASRQSVPHGFSQG